MDKLPPYVYPRPKRSAYVWRPYVPGQPRREIKLCGIHEPLSEVYRAWLALQDTQAKTFTLEWLFAEYERSDRFAELAPISQKGIRSRHRVICQYPLKDGAPFGKVSMNRITPGVVTALMEKVKADGGGSPSRANTFRTAISTAWQWAKSRDLVTLENPAKDALRLKNRVSKRYVTDEEYRLFYRLAQESNSIWLPSFIEIAYLCRLRKQEVINLRREHMLEEGLLCERLKGSDTNIVGWSPRLRAAIMDGSDWLIYRRDGSQLNGNRVNRVWNNVMNQSAYTLPRFTPHDLKAKGVSDTEVTLRRASAGHRSEQAAAVYDRVIDVVNPVG